MPPVGFEPTISPGAWIFVCCECRVLSGRGLCDELITRQEDSYRLWCVAVCDLETSRIGAPYIYICIYDISNLRVNYFVWKPDVKQQDFRNPLLDCTLSSGNQVIVFLLSFNIHFNIIIPSRFIFVSFVCATRCFCVLFSCFRLSHFARVSSVLKIKNSKNYIHMLSFLIIYLPPCPGSHTLVFFAFHAKRSTSYSVTHVYCHR